MSPEHLEIFMAEDNPGDVFWAELILRDLGVKYRLTVARNGEAALAMITRTGPYADCPKPHLVLLDISLPRITGPELIQRLGGRVPHPCCVVTGSLMEKEAVLKQFDFDVDCYIVKPLTRDKLIDAMATYDHLKPLAGRLRAG